MITKELAVTLRVGQELLHVSAKNADDTPLRCRVNGACKTWKREPERFRLPVKHGLRDTFYIENPHSFNDGSDPTQWCRCGRSRAGWSSTATR